MLNAIYAVFLFGLFVNNLIAMVLISATQGEYPITDYWTLAARNPACGAGSRTWKTREREEGRERGRGSLA